jgi:hypothetical protein
MSSFIQPESLRDGPTEAALFTTEDLPHERELVIDRIEGEHLLFVGEEKTFPITEAEGVLLAAVYGTNWIGQRVVLHVLDRQYISGPCVHLKVRGAAVPPVNLTPTWVF